MKRLRAESLERRYLIGDVCVRMVSIPAIPVTYNLARYGETYILAPGWARTSYDYILKVKLIGSDTRSDKINRRLGRVPRSRQIVSHFIRSRSLSSRFYDWEISARDHISPGLTVK